MSSFTCITCRVMFIDGDTQRAHYKTDWHRYNLKRKVVDLPAVSAENFRLRVLNAKKAEISEAKADLVCEPCKKHFNSSKALENHVKSKKHKEIAAKYGGKRHSESESDQVQSKQKPKPVIEVQDTEDMEEGDTDSDIESVDSFGSEDGLGIEECLFCSFISKTLEENVQHMSTKHSFFIPDAEYVSDLEGLITYLGKFDDGLGIEECLFCSFISKTLEENVQHMSTKHSFFIPDAEYVSDLEGLITYLGQKVGQGFMCLWCNEKGKVFRSVLSAQKHMIDKGHCKILHEGDVLLEYADYYDYRSSYPDYDPDNPRDGEEEMDIDSPEVDLETEGYELVLPSGSTIGHRALAKYYKQNINPRSAERTNAVLPKMLAQYKALGWTGTTGWAAEKRCKDLGAMQRFKNRHFTKLGVKANRLQHRFRNQNPI